MNNEQRISDNCPLTSDLCPSHLYNCRERFTNQTFLCKTNPILSAIGGLQMNVNLYVIKEYENETAFRLRENEPNQTRSEFIPKGAEITTGELLGILKPGTNFKRGAKTHLLKISCPMAQTCLC